MLDAVSRPAISQSSLPLGTRRWASVAFKISLTTFLLVTAALVFAFLMASSGRPATEWVSVYALAILAVSLLFTLYIDKVLTTPVKRLAMLATRMARGDYTHPVEHLSNDEMGELFAAVEFLRTSFLRQKEALEELNRSLDAKVEERTLELSKAVADLKAAQEALVRTERLASVGGLAGGVAHEINNPTGVILTRAGFLLRIAKEENLSEDVVDDIKAINSQAERIARITSSLLSFSRQAPAQKGPVEIAEMVTEALNLVEPTLRGSEVRVVKELAEVPRIEGDKGKLEQVLVNLMKNAIDAMPKGGTLSVRAVRVGASKVAITVADTGVGMPLEVQRKIFEPFFTTKEVGKGTGLGLSIAYGIVTEHGGELTVSSVPGHGTEFHLLLPVYEAGEVASNVKESGST